jgi:gluconate 2-dehydrogenase gamma chain
VLTDVQTGKATGFQPSSSVFFSAVREHTLHGMFSDPAYGGNKSFAGWDLVGYPGVKMPVKPVDQRVGATVRPAHRSTYTDPMFALLKKVAKP